MELLVGLLIAAFLLISIGLSSLFVYLFKGKKEFKKHLLDVFLVFTTITSWLIFFVGLSNLSEPFYKAIDPVVLDYQPFSQVHFLSLFLYLLLGFVSVYSIWKKGKQIPPLLLVIYVSILIVDFVICFEMILQLSSRFDDGLYIDESIGHFLIIAPLNFIIISILLLVKLIKEERVISNKREYKNHILNFLNEKLKHSNKISIWTFIILLPFYLAITLILILLG